MSRGARERGSRGEVAAWMVAMLVLGIAAGVLWNWVQDRQERWVAVQATACDAGAGWVRLGPGVAQLVCEQVEWQ